MRNIVGLTFAILSITLISCIEPEKKVETTADIFQSYRISGEGNVFSVPPGLASIFLDDDKAGNSELKVLLDDINHLSFLVIPHNYSIKENNYYSEVNQRFNNINFQDLAMINSGNEIVAVKISQGDSGDKIDELIIIVSNYESLFCISFKGDISFSNVASLTKPENMASISNLNRFNR